MSWRKDATGQVDQANKQTDFSQGFATGHRCRLHKHGAKVHPKFPKTQEKKEKYPQMPLALGLLMLMFYLGVLRIMPGSPTWEATWDRTWWDGARRPAQHRAKLPRNPECRH